MEKVWICWVYIGGLAFLIRQFEVPLLWYGLHCTCICSFGLTLFSKVSYYWDMKQVNRWDSFRDHKFLPCHGQETGHTASQTPHCCCLIMSQHKAYSSFLTFIVGSEAGKLSATTKSFPNWTEVMLLKDSTVAAWWCWDWTHIPKSLNTIVTACQFPDYSHISPQTTSGFPTVIQILSVPCFIHDTCVFLPGPCSSVKEVIQWEIPNKRLKIYGMIYITFFPVLLTHGTS